jgi:type I restriction enzyme, S subunit
LTNGDLIMSLTGTTGKEDFGYTVQVEKQGKNLLLNQRITKIVVKNTDQLNKSYLLLFLRSRVFLDKLYSIATGTRQANISTNKISQIHIPLPNIIKQGEIAAEVDSLASESLILKNNFKKKLSLLKELKMSILERAFKGELV